MKKILCLILTVLLCLYFSLAAAESAVAHYTLPDGAETVHCVDADSLELPPALQPVLPLLREDASSNAVIVRMPQGMVLFSLSAAPVRETLTPEQLVEKWSSVSRNLLKLPGVVDCEAGTAAAEEGLGTRVMHGGAELALQAETLLRVQADCFVFCESGVMYEVWRVSPVDLFEAGSGEDALLRSDLKTAEGFLAGLTFEQQTGGKEYTDPRGYFRVTLPDSALWLDVNSTAEEIEAIRDLFCAAHPECGETVFDILAEELAEEEAFLVFSSDMSAVAEAFSEELPSFEGVTADRLANLAGAIEKNLTEEYGYAECISNQSRRTVSGLEHSVLDYWVTCCGVDLQMEVCAAVQAPHLVREEDFYLLPDAQQSATAAAMELLLYFSDTMEYITD